MAIKEEKQQTTPPNKTSLIHVWGPSQIISFIEHERGICFDL